MSSKQRMHCVPLSWHDVHAKLRIDLLNDLKSTFLEILLLSNQSVNLRPGPTYPGFHLIERHGRYNPGVGSVSGGQAIRSVNDYTIPRNPNSEPN